MDQPATGLGRFIDWRLQFHCRHGGKIAVADCHCSKFRFIALIGPLACQLELVMIYCLYLKFGRSIFAARFARGCLKSVHVLVDNFTFWIDQ